MALQFEELGLITTMNTLLSEDIENFKIYTFSKEDFRKVNFCNSYQNKNLKSNKIRNFILC